MTDSQGTGSSDSQPVKWALEQARRDLVDLSRRNRLLHAPLGGKRPWCMAIVGHSPDELFDKLYRQENFRGYAFSARDGDDSDEDQTQSSALALQSSTLQPSASIRRPRLQTRLPPDKLERRLTKIFREERTLEEEQGLNTLFLALGFLKWFDSDQAEESFAPLVLVPVTMIRVSGGGDGYLLRGRDDEIVANISLREKLRTNFGIQLPDIPDDEQWKPSTYFDSISHEIGRQPRWEVNRDAVGIAFFQFSKFMMWRDLDAAAWPNNTLLNHALLKALLAENGQFETLPPLVPDDKPIDEHVDLSKCTHVVDADSSQAIVIEEARVGRNLVVQGPPGTGKSQTITNVIASAVHNGKTVLFVAEKTAALEVVYDRLKNAGLGTLCLEMHSRKANKREVLKSLDQALRFSGMSQFDANLPSKLASCRDKLNRWSNAIHKPIGQTGRSAFDVIGLQSKLRADQIRLLDGQLDEPANWSGTRLAASEVAVTRAAETVARLQTLPKDHPWWGTDIGSQNPFSLDRLMPKLNAAGNKLTALSTAVKKVFAGIGETSDPSISDAFATVKAFRHVAAVPKENRSALVDPAWVRDIAALERAIEEGERLTRFVSTVDGHFRRDAWTCDTARLVLTLRADGPSFLRRFTRRYRQANADLRAICRSKPPKGLKERIALLEALQKAQECRREFSSKMLSLSSALGPLWAELDTRWADARALAAWVRLGFSELGGARLIALAARTQDPHVFSPYAASIEAEASEACKAFDELQKEVRADIETVFGSADYACVAITRLINCVSIWVNNSDVINDWVVARDALLHLHNEGLGIIADGLIDGTVHPKEARPITDLLVSESLWRRAAAETPELTSIDGNVRSEHVSEFRELDHQRIRAARHEVLARYLDQRPTGYAAGEMGIIKAEIEKKRRHRPIRKLIYDAGSAMQRLKPVFLMSPLSAAQFLAPGRLMFDVLVIDEASQVAPEDALGVVARAKQIVVVGDDKQLPPTNFFKMVNAGDDDSEEDSHESIRPDRPTDFESILTLARTRGISERMLAWHYRSKHPSLIALSNDECYASRLLLPPSPFIQTSEFGLSLIQTPRGHYDRGGTSRDLVQAEEVAKSVAQHIRRCPNKSLGVACLSAQQRDAVDDMIDKLGIRSEVEGFTPRGERLFVKNLEAVQGDERDVIFISVGYGVAENQSKPFLNFGPVSRDGGERRLNVLASRAREKCVVFSSITAADIPADSEGRGTRMLRALLNFAETGKLSAGRPGGGFDSPFEEAVARAIREAGFHVHSQVGVSSFRIDLGVIDPPKPGEYILGVECDGAAYHSARSARDRDRLRQEVLEGLGWRLHRIWSTDWFRSPQRESAKLLASIRIAKDKASGPKVEAVHDDDLPEVEEENGVPDDAFATVVKDLDEPVVLSNTVEYKECPPTVPYRRDLLGLSVTEIARIALDVVEAEGPIHTEEVARRVREAFGLQKTGKRILAHVRAGLKHLARNGSVVRDGEFWSAVGRDLPAVRNRRNATLPLRRAAMIAPAEYQLAILTIIAEAVAIERDDLVVETTRLFGFDRTGPDLKEAIDKQTATLVKCGRLQLDGDSLRLEARGVRQNTESHLIPRDVSALRPDN